MTEQHRELQHIRVIELDERELHEDRYSLQQLHNQNQHDPNQNLDHDIYGIYAAKNNMGVMLLREKRYLDAANSFCEAVKYVNERSVYNYPRNEDMLSYNNIDYNDHNDDCYDNHRQSQPTHTPWSEIDTSEIDTSEIDSSSTTSILEASVDQKISTSNNIDSFYLLLDKETGDDNSQDGNRNDDKSTPYSVKSNDTYDSSQSRLHDEATFMFRNPIIVSNRRTHLASRRSSPRRSSINTSSSSETSESSTTAPVPTTSTPESATAIDKESCAKLSLVSVYNMALTYHLAALDNDKPNGAVQTTSGSDRNVTPSYVPAGPGTCDGAPRAKRRRSIECNSTNTDISSTTTATPFGECDSPYSISTNDADAMVSKIDASNNSPIISTNYNSSSNNISSDVDRVLLGQALAYYQIAYRILVSEQRVLVSQAMVILNNIGHIHRLMGKEENAKRCFQRLLTTMVYLQQTGDSNQISHWDCFLTNVIDLIIPPENSHKNFAAAA